MTHMTVLVMPNGTTRWKETTSRKLSVHNILLVLSNSCVIFFSRALREGDRILGVDATSSITRLPQARTQPSKCKIWIPIAARHTKPYSPLHRAHKAWFKWRGPLPIMKSSQRHSLRGSTIFALRYRRHRRLVTRFWLRQRGELHTVRWSGLRTVTFPRRTLAEKVRPRKGLRT